VLGAGLWGLFFLLMKKQISLFVTVLFFGLNIFAQRESYTINDAWYFTKQNISNDSNIVWEKINIPHTWNNEDANKFKLYYKGNAWYKKEFMLSPDDRDKTIYINFEGVSSYTEVYLNGQLIGNHKGGYSAFQFDITKYALLNKPNTLLVKVNNENTDITPLRGDFTFWGGIYRDVNLIKLNKIHFKSNSYGSNGILVQTPVVNNDLAKIKASIDLENSSAENSKITISCVVRDKKNTIVASQIQNIKLKTGTSTTIVCDKLQVNTPGLWSPDSPELYTVETLISDAKTNVQLDRIVANIGFRWFSIDPEKGFFLNGKHLKLIGVNRHQDFEGLGNALTDDFHHRDMQLIKDMGANFIRISHYPQDEAILNACDKLGLIAWEEIPLIESVLLNHEFQKTCETNFKEMVYQHYNHTAVVMWGLMNESIWGSIQVYSETDRKPYIERTHQIALKLDSISKAIDPQRLTTIAHHGDRDAYHKAGLCDVTNIVGWNVYNGWYGGDSKGFAETVDDEHAKFPGQKMIISEYGAGSDKRLHTQSGQSFDFSIEYQQQYHEAILPYILERPFLLATAVWNMFDFGSANRDESMPRVNNKGLCYYNRVPKDVYYYYQAMLSPKKVLHIATRDWTTLTQISAYDKVIFPVKVYSNCKNVELWVNGVSCGAKSMNNCYATWNVDFKAGQNAIIARGENGIEDVAAVNCDIIPENLANYGNQTFAIGINCGSNCNFTDDKSDFTWLADREYKPGGFGYLGGTCYKPTDYKIGFNDQVFGTRNVPLFQTLRLGADAYRFDVPSGEYEVELCFAEPKTENQTIIPTVNVSDILINKKIVLSKWNIAQENGRLFAISKKIRITVSQGEGVFIELKNISGTTLINAIRVSRI